MLDDGSVRHFTENFRLFLLSSVGIVPSTYGICLFETRVPLPWFRNIHCVPIKTGPLKKLL